MNNEKSFETTSPLAVSNSDSRLSVLRQTTLPTVASAIEEFIRAAPEHKLCRINALDFSANHSLDEEEAIATFLQAARLGIVELSWNVLCPGCGGVMDAGSTLKTVRCEVYECQLCAAGHEVTLDEMVEVTFTVSSRIRRIATHDPRNPMNLPRLTAFLCPFAEPHRTGYSTGNEALGLGPE